MPLSGNLSPDDVAAALVRLTCVEDGESCASFGWDRRAGD